MIHVLGIRHHGPGSCRNVEHALQRIQPDLMLIEGPADAQPILRFASEKDMKPPVAILIYEKKNLGQASYFPFATFSPEWQSMRYAFRQQIPVRFIDLPQSQMLRMREEGEMTFSVTEEIRRDPLAFLSSVAGHEDSERWWEATFEKWDASQEVFPLILELMRGLRDEMPEHDRETLVREAYMRKCIRKAVKEKFQNIAVVCGAWHAAVLADWERYSIKSDNALLRGLTKVGTVAAWVPWSYSQLTRAVGYGAGIDSPAWYELLYGRRQETAMRWMTQAARLLRKEALTVSPAEVVDATRLANALAAMREEPAPTLIELKDACLSVLCRGNTRRLSIIEQQLVIGTKVGRLPANAPKTPLQMDIEQRVRSARLRKYWESGEKGSKELDLRKTLHLNTSKLLHRLQIIGVSFGKRMAGSRYRQGSFSEKWKLEWKPGMSIQIVKAAKWGSQLKEAAIHKIHLEIQRVDQLVGLVELLRKCLYANLEQPLSELLSHIQFQMATTHDISLLMQCLSPMVRAMRYSSMRHQHTAFFEHIVRELMPRITAGLPAACVGIAHERAKGLLELLLETHHHVQVLADDTVLKSWLNALERCNAQMSIAPILGGGITRLLFDMKVYDADATADRLSYALAYRQSASDAAAWLEGFVQQSGLLILYQTSLWNILNEWVTQLEEGAFQEALPVLRRAFSEIPSPERVRLLALATRPESQPIEIHNWIYAGMNDPLWLPIMQTIDQMIGSETISPS